MDTLTKQKIGDFDTNLTIGNVRDVELQNELIKGYLERQYLADDDTIDKIQKSTEISILNLQMMM